jgi:hypothetical protein
MTETTQATPATTVETLRGWAHGFGHGIGWTGVVLLLAALFLLAGGPALGAVIAAVSGAGLLGAGASLVFATKG